MGNDHGGLADVSGARRAVFLDRDGVINELVAQSPNGPGESPLDRDDVRLMPGVTESLARLRADGWLLAGVTNQPAAAKGSVSVAELEAIQNRVEALLADGGVRFDAWRMCLHHPEGVIAELTGDCECRKPAPGMLIEIAHELGLDLAQSWMVGDTDADVLAGLAAGTRTVLIENSLSAHKRNAANTPTYAATDLSDAVRLIRGPARH